MPDLAGRGRVDVHCLDTEPVRHLPGPVRRRYPTGHLSEHHVYQARQIAHRWAVGVIVRYLFPAAGRVEGAESK